MYIGRVIPKHVKYPKAPVDKSRVLGSMTPPKSVRNLHDPPQIQYGICMTPPPPNKIKTHSI